MKITNLQKKKTKNGSDYLLVNNKLFAWQESKPAWQDLEEALENKTDLEIEFTEGKFPQITKIGNFVVPKRNFAKKNDSDITQAMERKEKSISQFAKQKNDAIRISGAQRDAVLVITTLYPELAEAENKEEAIKAEYKKWKQFFYHDKSEDETPF